MPQRILGGQFAKAMAAQQDTERKEKTLNAPSRIDVLVVVTDKVMAKPHPSKHNAESYRGALLGAREASASRNESESLGSITGELVEKSAQIAEFHVKYFATVKKGMATYMRNAGPVASRNP